jgi:hypothetical protein
VDARGITADGEHFFGEWKTMSNYRARFMEEEKLKWKTDPQALTYGVLVPETKLFTVRWAIKPNAKAKTPTVSFDFEWYTYTQAEVDHWRSQLIQIADEIRRNRKAGLLPWRTNFGNCFRYGIAYQCPFYGKCSTQDWASPMDKPRTPHLAFEREKKNELDKSIKDLVILDASRVGDYLECPESYRRRWEGEGHQEEGEALTIGTDFHAAIATSIKEKIKC